jgi:PAS domain S-box-containing protein
VVITGQSDGAGTAMSESATSGRSIRAEVLLLCAISVFLVAGLAGGFAHHLLKQQQQQQTMLSLHDLADERATDIESYMDDRVHHLSEFSQSIEVSIAMRKLDQAYPGGIHSTDYQDMDDDFRPMFQSMLEHEYYYDIFLINRNGDIVFTVTHESDFATNLITGPYRDTGLAHAWRDAIDQLSPTISQFERYKPSKEPALFMAAPIIHNGQMYGVLAFQLNTDAFYRVAGDLGGLGNTGEIILGVDQGDDVLITAPTRHNPDAAFKQKITRHSELAKPIKDATRGQTGHGMFQDLRGVAVLAAWEYLPSLNWGLVAKIDQSEAMAALDVISSRLIMVIGTILVLVLAGVAWRTNRITRPLIRLTRVASNIASRDRFDIDAPMDTPVAEINELSVAFNRMSSEILSYQNKLEDKVKTRTAELSRLKTAIEQTNDIVMITDRDAIIEYVNPAFEKISGYSAEEAVGRRAVLIKSGEMSQAFYKQMWDTILAGHNWQADFINRNKAGELYEVKQMISPIKNDDGNITGFVSVQRDITNEKYQQERLEHTQRLESLGVLAGGIAHDFNNLLTAILGNAGLARRRTPDDSPIAVNLKHIEDASERAADLCKQMLAYSGKGKFIVIPINLNTLVTDITKLLSISITKNVSLRTDLDAALPAIDADKAQMQQVIMNLVINASEAIGEDNGNIVIHTGVMDADASYLQTTHIDDPLPTGRYVFMEVSDDGCGMDKQTLKKLFDPFFTTKFTGRGLGMSAILGIVRGHHGAIKVYSEAGKGTTFKVLFPVAAGIASPDTSTTPATNTRPWTGQGMILVVDDEEGLRETASLMLEEIGFQVITACDGIEAVEIFSRSHAEIDIVLLDMTMPRMDGKTAFREMRRIDPEVRVILSSGYNEQDATSHFAGKGLAGFIQKPYHLTALRQKFQEIFSD